jgi:uncharacterized protein YecT (DUF1311 family)
MQRSSKFLALMSCALLAIWFQASHAETLENHRINCLRQTTRLAKLICSDTTLEQLDKQLDQTYLETMSDVDDDQQPIVLHEEQSFMVLRDKCVTSSITSTSPFPTPEEKQCLVNLYETRYTQLKSWPEDPPQEISASGPAGKLLLTLHFDRAKQTYQTDVEMLTPADRKLNDGNFTGCVNSPNRVIMDLAKYLQQEHQLLLTALPQGFIIHSMNSCAEQPTWQLNVITPKCTASAPATGVAGKPATIGGFADRIYFAYLKNNQTIPSFMEIDAEGKISYHMPDDLKALDLSSEPEIDC